MDLVCFAFGNISKNIEIVAPRGKVEIGWVRPVAKSRLYEIVRDCTRLRRSRREPAERTRLYEIARDRSNGVGGASKVLQVDS